MELKFDDFKGSVFKECVVTDTNIIFTLEESEYENKIVLNYSPEKMKNKHGRLGEFLRIPK